MIRIEAFCDDKKAGQVLHALEGLVIQVTMIPVRNAVAKGKKVVGAGQPTTGTEVINAVIATALKIGATLITRKEILAAAQTYGVAATAVSSALAKHPDLKGQGKGGYKIVSKQEQK